jgi:hypothetical protein
LRIQLVVIALVSVCLHQPGFGQQSPLPKHLIDAKDLVAHLDLDQTNYEHGEGHVVWTGRRSSRTDCSGFVDALLTHCYGYQKDDYKKWFDSHRPSARRYHDAIVEGRGFDLIPQVTDVRAGDLLAVKYLQKKENTGHIMLVVDVPKRMAHKQPHIEGTIQWEVPVIDSSMSGHGPTDTRHKRGKDGKDHEGLGQGVFRLYSDSQGAVRGFAWSTYEKSQFQPPEEEHLVIGRLKPGFRP